MAIFGLGVLVFGLMTLTNRVILPSIRAIDDRHDLPRGSVWRRLLIKLSPNEIMKLSAA